MNWSIMVMQRQHPLLNLLCLEDYLPCAGGLSAVRPCFNGEI